MRTKEDTMLNTIQDKCKLFFPFKRPWIPPNTTMDYGVLFETVFAYTGMSVLRPTIQARRRHAGTQGPCPRPCETM